MQGGVRHVFWINAQNVDRGFVSVSSQMINTFVKKFKAKIEKGNWISTLVYARKFEFFNSFSFRPLFSFANFFVKVFTSEDSDNGLSLFHHFLFPTLNHALINLSFLYIILSCWGHVGHHGYKTQISIGDNCDFQHVMEHELGHTVGFWHEQSRPDRDNYISVIWENVLDGNYKKRFFPVW